MTAGYFVVVECQTWIDDFAGNHFIGMREVMFIMAIRASESCHSRHGVTASPSTTSSLLVVGSGRWHIPKRHSGQRPNVDTHFHGRCAGEHVDRWSAIVPGSGTKIHILEQQFVFFGF